MNRFLVILLCASMMLSGCTGINDENSDEVFEILGCTDSEALNFDEKATKNDESCFYGETQKFLKSPILMDATIQIQYIVCYLSLLMHL